MAIRRHKLDIVFSALIRERANWYCEACCQNFRMGMNGALDCSHIVSRRHVGTRWHPANACSMCRRCHMFYTEHPFDFNDWAIDYFGADHIAELRRVANQPVKWSKKVREDIYRHYKGELNRLESLRAAGEMMKIEILPHELMHQFEVME